MRELEALIRDIDREIERAFEQTFEATAKNFEEMVEHLFPGGRGSLRRVSLRPVRDAADEREPAPSASRSEEAEEEEQREELGVEIEVTPAGKSTRKLSLLSGGEKSLVALAFVFAVFLARPCPFYILDEVEAALDDANIDRFLQLIRRFSDRAQFVIVTHQKRTMDAADVLYGVSMGGDGVTKVVSRRLPREAAEDERRERRGARRGDARAAAVRRDRREEETRCARPGLIGEQPAAATGRRLGRSRLTSFASERKAEHLFLATSGLRYAGSRGRKGGPMAQRHMDRLTSFDTSFLTNEKSNGHMAIGAVLVCEGEPPSHEDFVTHIRSRLHLLPRLRQRLAFPPLRLGRPFWVDDPEFDVHEHVRRAVAARAGHRRAVPRAGRRDLSPPLDRSKPLWELWPGRRLRGRPLRDRLQDPSRDGRRHLGGRHRHAALRRRAEGRARARARSPGSRTGRRRACASSAGRLSGLVRRWSRARPLALARACSNPRRAPASARLDGARRPLGGELEPDQAGAQGASQRRDRPHRGFCWTRCDLDEFKRIKNALGGTVNDVTLAVDGGRPAALASGPRPRGRGAAELQALVPVSVRTENEHGELGNRLTAMRGPLPVHIADPVERLRTSPRRWTR